MGKIMILDVPVIHQGYLEFINRHRAESDELFVLGKDLISEFSPFREIRAIDPNTAVEMLKIYAGLRFLKVLDRDGIENYKHYLSGNMIIISNDEISRKLAEKYLVNSKIEIDTAFLRWDEKSVLSKSNVNHDGISNDEFDLKMMEMAAKESEMASDWWRRVGCILIKDKKIIFKAHNIHLPTEQTPYINGDPRDFIKAGQNCDIASSLHCEQQAIVWAAREGVSLKGVHLYVTVFPCPICAKIVAHSGISKVFYLTGHASLDGEDILKNKGVEITLVK